MSNTPQTQSRALRVPAGRINRFARLGGVATGIAGTMALNAMGQMGRGTKPEFRSLLMTPGNMRRLADELARMRGAAMKVGQLISMDAGDVLPPELADIMGRLRDQAHFMPPGQLKKVLNANWGNDWLRDLRRFDVHPIAAASIGQVHRAMLKDGRDVAIKVQYPGIAKSIDSDVTNVGALVRMTGLLPKGFDLAPYMDEARRQLHEETDYAREGNYLHRFGDWLAGDIRFEVPIHHADWSTSDILCMSYVEGHAIEDAGAQPLETRNQIMQDLIELMLREVFELGVIQSDPNFANFRFNPDTGRIVLLDFGAARPIKAQVVDQYRRLIQTGMAGDYGAAENVADEMGILPATPSKHREQLVQMMGMVFDDLRRAQVYDFTDMTLSRKMQEQGRALAESGYLPPAVDMDVLYLQRKFGGIFLLAHRLGVHIPLRALLARFV
ncbi:MAG: ABC1 kinase family protein [Roseovarius sp.]